MSRVRKIDPKNEFFGGVFLYAAGVTCGASVAWLAGEPVGTGAAVGLSLSTALFFWRQVSNGGPIINFAGGRNKGTHKRQFASMSPWVIDDGKKTSIVKWHDRRDKPPESFVFQGLQTQVSEYTMYRFLHIALRRQRIVFDSNCNTLKRNGKRLKPQEILSEGHYTTMASPRFLPDQYKTIREILELTNLWINHRTGHPGYLNVEFNTPAHRVLATARWRWIDLQLEIDNIRKSQPFWKIPRL